MTSLYSDMFVVVVEDERPLEETTPVDGALCVVVSTGVTSLVEWTQQTTSEGFYLASSLKPIVTLDSGKVVI